MTIRSVPIIDIAPFLSGTLEDKRRVAAEVGRACEEIGFLIVGSDQAFAGQLRINRCFDLLVDEIIELGRVFHIDPLVCLEPGKIRILIEVVSNILSICSSCC